MFNLIKKILTYFNLLIIKINKLEFENSIFTHLTIEEKLKLLNLAKKCKGRNYVEIGSYLGASSCFIAAGIKSTKKNARLFCIDTWNNDAMTEGNKDTFNLFQQNTKKYSEVITQIRELSVNASKRIDTKVDFIFFDGDHSYEGIFNDWKSWYPKLNKGAIVVFHDYGWAEGVKKVIEEEVRPNIINEFKLPNMYGAILK